MPGAGAATNGSYPGYPGGAGAPLNSSYPGYPGGAGAPPNGSYPDGAAAALARQCFTKGDHVIKQLSLDKVSVVVSHSSIFWYHSRILSFLYLDALHVLDASAQFDAGHTTHNLLIDASNRGNMVTKFIL